MQAMDEFDVIPDTPSPMIHMGGSKGQRRVAAENTNLARTKKLKQLQELATSTEDLIDPHPSVFGKDTHRRLSQRLLMKSDYVMDTDSDSAISATSNRQENGSSTAAVASGEDGDLSSDLEPPARSRKPKTKKSAAKPKSSGFLNLDFSDDSDFEILPLKSSSSSSSSSSTSKSGKAKKNKRRSLLPPVRSSDSADPNDYKDFFVEYMEQVKTKNCGSFFPSLNDAAPKAPTSSLVAADSSKNQAGDQSCIIVSDDDVDLQNEVFPEPSRNHHHHQQVVSTTSQPDMDTDTHSGARPKTTLFFNNSSSSSNIRAKHSYHHADHNSSSDSDSLLSPPKKSKASHLAEEQKLARRNLMRVDVDLFESPEPSPPSISRSGQQQSSPSGGYLQQQQQQGSLLSSPQQQQQQQKYSPVSSAATLTIDWNAAPHPTLDPGTSIRASPHTQSSPMNTDDDNDSSDLDEAKWERAILEMSKPYVDLAKRPSPSARNKKKGRRRTSALQQGQGQGQRSDGNVSRSVVPDIVVTEDGQEVSSTHHAATFNLSPSIAFTSSNQTISFTGRPSGEGDNNNNNGGGGSGGKDGKHIVKCSPSSSHCDGQQSGVVSASDSPLANMIVDMAIADVDFDTEMTQPPRPFAPRPSTSTSAASSSSQFPGFQLASTLMMLPNAASNASSSLSKEPCKWFPPTTTSATTTSSSSTSSSGSADSPLSLFTTTFPEGDGAHSSLMNNLSSAATHRRRRSTPRASSSTTSTSSFSLRIRQRSPNHRRRLHTNAYEEDDDDLLVLDDLAAEERGAVGGGGDWRQRHPGTAEDVFEAVSGLEQVRRRQRQPRAQAGVPRQQLQVESDEAMARRLQEEMDLEFATKLAAKPPTPGPTTASRGRRPHGATSPSHGGSRGHPARGRGVAVIHDLMLRMIADMDDYDFSVHLALAVGQDIPEPSDGQQRSLEDIVRTELLIFVERNGVEYVQAVRHQQQQQQQAGSGNGGLPPRLAAYTTAHPRGPTVAEGALLPDAGDEVPLASRYQRRASRPSNRMTRSSSEALAMLRVDDSLGDRDDEQLDGIPRAVAGQVSLMPAFSQGGDPSPFLMLDDLRTTQWYNSGRRRMPPVVVGDDYEELLALGDRIGDVRPKGLSQEKIDQLPQRTFKKADGTGLSTSREELECNVCCCEYCDGEKLRRLPCLHEYHSECIDMWIKKNPTCPVCRVDLGQMYAGNNSFSMPS